MVTKGIITAIPVSEDESKYLVRLPFFEDATQDSDEIIYEATLSEPSGVIQGYSVGDIVYCTFEDNDAGRPVIIGKLFARGLENIGAEFSTLELDVANRASLPANTTIGSITPEEIANIPSIKGKLDKMGGTIFGALEFDNTVQYVVGRNVNIVDNSGHIIQSELTDHLFADSMTRQCSAGTGGTGESSGYIRLCDITLTKHYQARFISFRIYVGQGNNGRIDQNAYIELLLQSGWTGSENGRFGGYWELHKLGTSLTYDNFDIIVTSNSNLQYSVWLGITSVGYCKPSYTVWYDRELLNDPTNTCTITHAGSVRQTAVPTGTDPNCLIGHGTTGEIVSDKIKQTLTTSNANYPVLFAPSGQAATTSGADVYFATTLQYNPAAAKLELQAPNGYITTNDTTSGIKASLAVGSGHANHGFYSNGYYSSSTFVSDPKWIVYRNSAGNVVLNGNAETATTATKLGSSTIGDGSTPIYLSSGTATSCDYPVSGNWFRGVVSVTSAGVSEMGRYIDFHPTGNSTLDYSKRLDAGTGTTKRILTLPDKTGTLACTSDIPTITIGTADPSGGSDGDIYIQYTV